MTIAFENECYSTFVENFHAYRINSFQQVREEFAVTATRNIFLVESIHYN